MPRTRNHWEFVGPLAVLSSCKSVQSTQYSCSESRLSAPVIVVWSVMIGSSTFCFHPLQQPGRRLVELSKVASNSETPLRPGHAVDSTVHVTVSTEHLESPSLFHIDTSWTCSHHLLSDLTSSTTCSTLRNQRFRLRRFSKTSNRVSMDKHRLHYHVGRDEHMRFS